MSIQKIKVLKFGGTSVKNPQRLVHVAQIIAREKAHKCIVVVSAMGQTTDTLVKLASRCSQTPNPRELDVLLATGEQQAIALLSIVLSDLGVRARSFTGAQLGIITEANYGNAEILSIDKSKIEEAFQTHDVIVVAGFQGVTATGDITTLGRGGSDTSAVALAAATQAELCEIYTDVDGIFTADPNIINGALQHSILSYEDCLELAAKGAQVIHPRAVECARENGIDIAVRSVFNPENEGTLITSGNGSTWERPGLVGIAVTSGFSLLTIECQQESDLKELDDFIRGLVGAVNVQETIWRLAHTAQVNYIISGLSKPIAERLLQSLAEAEAKPRGKLRLDYVRLSIVGKEAPLAPRESKTIEEIQTWLAQNSLLSTASELSLSIYLEEEKAVDVWNQLHEILKPQLTKGEEARKALVGSTG
ncbi:MAG: aspartate kinase [Candidatus Melainabacteria bacterium]|nr:aspartate kinase [Candidatus Melainabacteria bacterium]